ncbi:TonB-dependent receptor [Novimethylophilus kurashikiensis]|uniref:TonB-dependent receptor n=1 Tax=Novimethylophilus kurashikiensis TaxID=1825523 RepID=A0A2R5FCH6_9PROT|nr:disulfide isomerase DsbC N-terminal domain-containing protein [Novimethylophilus kurashikiensis]GBG14411.1 TonB-dependent receptor [Novimethylophilus kurashikiensis]
MPAALPPEALATPPAIMARAPECHILSPEEAQVAFHRLRARLPGTAFAGAAPSQVCGMVRVMLQRGTVAYTDATGRYFLLALALDTHVGSPADLSEDIDSAIEARSQYPSEPIPGVARPSDYTPPPLQSKPTLFQK